MTGPLLLGALLLLGACSEPPPPEPAPEATIIAPAPRPIALAFVGSERCAACHREAYEAWVGSDHQRAMEPVSAESVLGDFDDAAHAHFAESARFVGGAGEPTVVFEAPDGALARYPVTATFGVDPLQQYLAAFPGGRQQVTTMAWDTRPGDAGGQRWFHVYPEESTPPGDALHWAGELQNWNSQCAECHSTGLRKGYDFEGDRYETTYAEISVGCEGCHGRGSRHLQWAESRAGEESGDEPGGEPAYDEGDALGLEHRLGIPGSWIHRDASGIAQREPALGANRQPEACGRCHARRGSRSDDYRYGEHLLETHRPAVIEPALYHPDGQILDEVYVYGSFLQSKMYQAGVTCSDCHDPHTAKIRYAGDALCAQCHLPSVFAAESHARHPAGSVACTDCHMAERTYMVVDDRGDHSFRVPRPDLSLELGTPNACTGCHDDKDDRWAAETVAAWYPDGRSGTPHFGQALAAAWAGDPGALLALTELALDRQEPAIVRGSALQAMANLPLSLDELAAIEQSLADPSPLVRFSALEALRTAPLQYALPLAVTRLDDPVAGVRIAAATVAAPGDGKLPVPAQRDFDRAAAEAMAAARYDFDREAGHLNYASFLLARGEVQRAERWFRRALTRYPESVVLRVNLADALRRLERDGDGVAVLEEARTLEPEAPVVREALALAYVRAQRHGDAVPELRALVTLDPDSPRAGALLYLALDRVGEREEADSLLRALRTRFPDDPMVGSLQ